MKPNNQYELLLTIRGQQQRRIKLDQPTLLIGSLTSNQIVINSANVEPIHALIELDSSGDWFVTDLVSANGIQINDKKISIEKKLNPNDKISIGDSEITIQVQPDIPVIDI